MQERRQGRDVSAQSDQPPVADYDARLSYLMRRGAPEKLKQVLVRTGGHIPAEGPNRGRLRRAMQGYFNSAT